MDRIFARTEGRCKGCTLDLRLKGLQVLRFVAQCGVQEEENCAVFEDKIRANVSEGPVEASLPDKKSAFCE
jgi:hypothetical protein